MFRWAGWFAVANSVLFGAVSLRYFGGGVTVDSPLAWIYLVSVYIGHHVLLTTIPLFLLATPLVLLVPRRRVLTVAAVLLFALMLSLMMLDSLLWSQSRFHINALTMKILGWQSWVFAAVIFVIGLVFESLLARSVWGWVLASGIRRGRLLGAFCAAMVLLSQGIHVWADASYYVPVTSLAQVLPVYRGVKAKRMLTRLGLVNVVASRERGLARQVAEDLDETSARLLNYPLHPLQCASGKPLNLVFVFADAMRGDIVTPENTPNITRFAARHGMDFRNHFSGGNSSRMGMFSLFYSLPPGYWSSFASVQQPAVLVDELQDRNYQLGIFTSATIYRPVALDRTAFARVPNLRMATEPESDPPWKRDRKLTREWFDWLDARDPERPFFGFLFYDATNAASLPPGYPETYQPVDDSEDAVRFARYRNTVHFVDGVIGEVLDNLEQRGLLENTVVMVSADHGEEFGESDAKLQKHGSGYTRYQLVVPMILSWPGKPSGVAYEQRTSHYDVVPTLMKELFGCSNPASDYSVGHDLFEMKPWDWIIAGSYYNYAILEPDQVTVTFPNGLYEVRDWNYRLLDKPQFRGDVLEGVSEQNSRFYRD